jgi:hypothetical protein
MKEFRWSEEKNKELKIARGVSFEQLLDSKFIGIVEHPAREHQQLMLIEYKGYVWVVPFISGKRYYFLKTAFPSRKYTQKYFGGISHEED